MKRKFLAHFLYFVVMVGCSSCMCFKTLDNLSSDNKLLEEAKETLKQKVDSGEKTMLLNIIEKQIASNNERLAQKLAKTKASNVKVAAQKLKDKQNN